MEGLKDIILKEHSKAQALLIADIVFQKPDLLNELITCTFAQTEPLSRRAAWPLRIIQDQHPELLISKIEDIITQLQDTHDSAVLRNVLALLIQARIPLNQTPFLIDYTTRVILNGNSPIAVIIHASDLYLKLAENETSLIKELILMLEQISQYNSGGIKAKLGQVYKHLNRLEKT